MAGEIRWGTNQRNAEVMSKFFVIESKSIYHIDQVRTNYGKFNLHFSGTSIWDKLDEELKVCLKLNLTSNDCKQFLTSYA